MTAHVYLQVATQPPLLPPQASAGMRACLCARFSATLSLLPRLRSLTRMCLRAQLGELSFDASCRGHFDTWPKYTTSRLSQVVLAACRCRCVWHAGSEAGLGMPGDSRLHLLCSALGGLRCCGLLCAWVAAGVALRCLGSHITHALALTCLTLPLACNQWSVLHVKVPGNASKWERKRTRLLACSTAGRVSI